MIWILLPMKITNDPHPSSTKTIIPLGSNLIKRIVIKQNPSHVFQLIISIFKAQYWELYSWSFWCNQLAFQPKTISSHLNATTPCHTTSAVSLLILTSLPDTISTQLLFQCHPPQEFFRSWTAPLWVSILAPGPRPPATNHTVQPTPSPPSRMYTRLLSSLFGWRILMRLK